MATSALAARGLTKASFDGISMNEATLDKISKTFKTLQDFMRKSGWNELYTMNDLKSLVNRTDIPPEVREAATYIVSNPAVLKATDSEFGRYFDGPNQQDGRSTIGSFGVKITDLEALKQDLRAEKGPSSTLSPNDVIDKARQILPALMAKMQEKLDALEGSDKDPVKAMELKQVMDELSQMTKLLTKALDGITKPVTDTLDSMR